MSLLADVALGLSRTQPVRADGTCLHCGATNARYGQHRPGCAWWRACVYVAPRVRAEAERAKLDARGPRRCSGCGETKPSSEFYRDRTRGSGLDARCKKCKRRENYDRWQARKAEANA